MSLKGILKKSGALLMSAAMLCTGAVVLPQVTDTELIANASYAGDFDYDQDPESGGITVTAYSGDDINVVIPSKIDGYTVTGIGKNVDSGDSIFSEYGLEEKIVSVQLPQTVKYIYNDAFSGCENLEKVNIPDGVKYLGQSMLCFCEKIKEIVIPSSVRDNVYGSDGYYNCFAQSYIRKIIIKKNNFDLNAAALDRYGATTVYAYRGTDSYKSAVKLRNNEDYKITLEEIVDPSAIKLNSGSIKLDPGKTYALKATLSFPSASGNPMKNNTVSWSSSDSSVASVSNGTVTAKKSGTVKITAKTVNDKTAACMVDVYGPPLSISLSNSAMSLGKGETVKLSAYVGPQNAKDKSVSWRTSKSSVATVDKSGIVTTKNSGTVYITATANGNKKLEKSCKIVVKDAPSKIILTKGILTIGVGERYTLGSCVNDGSACSKRTYRTSNSSIVKMTRTDWQGDFVGVKPGVAYVTVRSYNGKESTCKVTIKKAPSKVTISKKAITLKVGQTASLSAAIPSDAGCAKRTFRTSNSSVVKMTKTNWTGSFKAMKKGTAYVTVRTYNGKESSCKVTVV